MYTIEEVVDICSNRKWEELKSLMTSDIKDPHWRILATAVFEAYHHDKNYGLNVWDNHLEERPIPNDYYQLLTGNVSLLDFHKALHFAQTTLKDEKIVLAIRGYVNKQEKLWNLLNDEDMPDELAILLKKDFQRVSSSNLLSRIQHSGGSPIYNRNEQRRNEHGTRQCCKCSIV